MANVLVNGNSLSAIADAIRQKTGNEDTYKPAEMAQAILDLPSGGEDLEEKDVNFYDYDGVLLHSYTLAEVQSLSALPAVPPAPNGLVSHGWNWTLEELREWAERANVGHMVYAPDGVAIMRVSLDHAATLYVSYVDGTGSRVDWGDGTEDSYNARDVKAYHQFEPGQYTITVYASAISSISNVCGYEDSSYTPSDALIEAYFPASVSSAWLYRRQRVKKTSVAVGPYYNYCPSLSGIVTKPNGGAIALDGLAVKHPAFAFGTALYSGAFDIGADAMYGVHLSIATQDNVSLVRDVVHVGDVDKREFYKNQSLTRLILRDCQNIGDNLLNEAIGIVYLEIPADVTSIGSSFLAATKQYYYYAPLTIKFLGAVPPTVADSSAIGNRTVRILVPAGSLAAYKAATNLTRYAAKMEEY